MAKRTKLLFILLVALTTVNCGGGGNSSGSDNPPQDSEQPVSEKSNSLIFSSSDVQTLPIGQTLSNPASGFASGEIVYDSSDTRIVTVDSNGLVTAHGLGRATVSARQEADKTYSAASAEYEIHTSTLMLAWAGESDTLLEFPEAMYGMALYSSTQQACDTNNISACENGSVQTVDSRMVDSNADLNTPAFFNLDGTTEVAAWPRHFGSRSGHQVVEFNGKLWLFGGSGGGRAYIEPWVSEDGKIWQMMESNLQTGWTNHQVVVHAGKLFLIGGNESDVWTSENGTVWTQLTNSAEFPSRANHQTVSFDGKLWLIGGTTFDNGTQKTYADVWSSTDGTSWKQELENAPFGERSGHSVAVFNDRLWLTGGAYAEQNQEVWSSDNGIDWEKEVMLTGLPYLSEHQMVTHNEMLWIIGDSYYPNRTEIWKSDNGADWEPENVDAADLANGSIYLHQVVSFNEKLWIIGGVYHVELHGGSGGSKRRDLVWSSETGKHWKQESPPHSLPEDKYYGLIPVATSDNELLLLDPTYHDTPTTAEVWKSSDGIEWTIHETNGGLLSRSGHQLTFFKSKFWLIGGFNTKSDAPALNDVWSSKDGISWTLETENAGFPAEFGHRVVVHQDRLWLFSQVEVNGSTTNEIWASEDGITWELVTSVPEFSPRDRYELASFDGKLWVVGGYSLNDHYFKGDAWYSSDGKTWSNATPEPSFPGRAYHQVTNFNDKLWLIGGYDNGINTLNDIWFSDNGLDWTQISENAPFPARYGHQLENFDNKLWLIGGTGQHAEQFRGVWQFTESDGWRKGYSREFIAE